MAIEKSYYENNKVRMYRKGKQRTLILDGWVYKSDTLLLEKQDIPSESVTFSAHCIGGSIVGYAVILNNGYIDIYNQANGVKILNAANVVGSVTYYV